jgi:uncharacterized protein YndB with AHSA1/START domain
MVERSSTGEKASRRIGALRLTVKSDREAQLTRVFDAPRRLVFDAMSKPEHLRRWWGPRRSTMTSCEMVDFRPGGKWRFVLREADGTEYAFRGEYREIVPPERVVQTFEFEGMPGAVSVELPPTPSANGDGEKLYTKGAGCCPRCGRG